MSIQTVQVAKSRRAGLGLIVALLAVAVGMALWLNQASAAFPTTTVAVTNQTVGPVAPGDPVSYTVTLTIAGGPTTGTDVDFRFTAPAGFTPTTVVGDGAFNGQFVEAACQAAIAGGLTAGECTTETDGGALEAGTYVVTVSGTAAAADVPAVTFTFADSDADIESATSDAITVDAGELVTVSADATNPVTVPHTFTFTLDPLVTCDSDPDVDDQVECTATDINNPDGADIVSIAVVDPDITDETTVEVTINSDTADDYAISLLLSLTEEVGDVTLEYPEVVAFESPAGTKTYEDVDLVHIDPFDDPIDIIDVENNVIGYLHVVCAVNFPVNGLWPTTVDDDPETFNFKITPTSGTPNIIGPVVAAGVDCDGDGADDSTLTWYSTQTGEQAIEVVDDLGTVVLDAGGSDAPFNTPLIKEWNTLLPTIITAVDIEDGDDVGGLINEEIAAATNYDGTTVNLPAVLNPATGIYESDSNSYFENVLGSHVTNTGSTLVTIATGATVDFDITSDCGYVRLRIADDYTDAITDYDGDGILDDAYNNDTFVRSISVTSVGESIEFQVTSYDANMDDDDWDCSLLDVIELDIQASYPASVLGSVVPTNPALETISFVLRHQPAAKQVLLAWAGQRIVLEHDWRLYPGDYSDLEAAGFCPFDGQEGSTEIVYVKGGGPGNFLSGLGANDEDAYNDAVSVLVSGVSQVDDVPDFPQEACISRVLFESEQPGQVDIEAFLSDEDAENFDVSKVAFVIYYMKFESVDLSLVTQVSKPTHNGSAAGYRDYAPGNPWDATADDADGTADWNVSRDILVRGRVSGWFVNENPSGRAADTTDPYNVLPANRWVMPIDWAMLAGGPVDPADGTDALGTAEEFRPYYNLLFAPNNMEGIALLTPDGSVAAQVAVVTAITGITNTGATFGVSTFSGLYNGATVTVGASTTPRTATLNANGTITIAPALAAAPAAGTPVFILTGVPFEGPYSLIDIPGLAATNDGVAGAALSNIPGPTNSATRDTILADSDIDWWDAPMPPAMVSVKIRNAGFIKQVFKDEVYYIGTPNSTAQVYPNPFYLSNIPDSPFIPAVVAGGGYLWNSWGNDGPAAAAGLASSEAGAAAGQSGDGPYWFWTPARIGANSEGVMDPLVSNPASPKAIELAAIRTAYDTDLATAGSQPDVTIARDLVVYSDNHGEFMVTANGDFNLTYDECDTNTLGGGKLCAPGDKVGVSTITSTADYPDFRGKHFPVASNAVTVNWLWGGYKDVTIEPDPNEPQIAYVVFHAVDRDGFCNVPVGAVSLHSVLTAYDTASPVGGSTALGNQVEVVDFLIDSDEGGIILDTNAGQPPISVTKEFASGVSTFSTAVNTTIREFPNSDLAASETADECQAWIRISNSLLAITNVLVVAHNDPPEGNVTFDRIVDFSDTATVTLNFRWSLVTWTGSNNIPVEDALKGTGLNEGGSDIFDQVTAVYGWDAAAQDWLGYFPAGVGVPGANDLTALQAGQAYWIAIKGPSSVTWTIETNVDQ